MEILVLVKQTKEWEGLPAMLNPADQNALEAALQMKDQFGGKLTVLTMGPAGSEKMLKECLAMGADSAVLLQDNALAGADTLVTARALTAAVKKLGGFDLILAGARSIDGATGQVGPKVAAMLGLPILAYARELSLDGNLLKIVRDNNPLTETWQAQLPALCTVVQGANKPRSAILKNKLAANRAQIPVWTVTDLGLNAGALVSPSAVTGAWKPQKAAVGTKLTSVKELVKVLVEQKVLS